MTAPDPRLGEIKDRWAGSDVEPLGVAISENRKWALVLAHSGTADERVLAKVVDDDDATRFANAPADVAYLLSVVEAQAAQITKVRELADKWAAESNGLGLDLSEDDFDRGWHGARRIGTDQLRATLAPEGPEA